MSQTASIESETISTSETECQALREKQASNPEVEAMKAIITVIKDSEFDAGARAEDLRAQLFEFMDSLTTKDCEVFTRDLRMSMDTMLLNRLSKANEQKVTVTKEVIEGIKSRLAEANALVLKLS